MPKLFFTLLILLNISVSWGKEQEIKILLTNNTWLKADLVKSDAEGNLTILLNKKERILRSKEFKMVKMSSLPQPMRKAEELFKQNKTDEAGKLLDTISDKYNFPPIQVKIKVLQAQIKIAQADTEGAISILKPLLEKEISMPESEAAAYAHSFLLLAKSHEKLNQRDDAAKAYRRSFELAVPEYSATANLNLGEMLLKQKNTKGALDCFLENISVFSPEIPGRKLSLQKTIAIYKENKSKKLKLYEDMFKKDYPQK